ncbi:MAG: Hsp20/alpha crystallin family protein [Bdellovibrionales bacterium]|nr:Hsp20/alpha crystallin family protein [Bdellovibrionales bacterium]
MSRLELWQKNWDPFREFGLQPRGVERFFDDLFSNRLQRNDKNMIQPNVEVHETKNMYLMKFDLPGLNKDQIKVDLHDNTLTVSGERKDKVEGEDKDKKTHFSEVYYGSFLRTFTFPESVDGEKVEAKYENGVLSLSIPKQEASAKRQIAIR